MNGIRVNGTHALTRALTVDAVARVYSNLRQAVDRHALGLKAAVESGNYFRGGTGALQSTLWTSPARVRGADVVAEVGWGVRYGPVLEWGPRTDEWTIRAKYAKALRFRIGNRIVYAKSVRHKWRPGSLRPHWSAEIQRRDPMFSDLVGRALEGAFNG